MIFDSLSQEIPREERNRLFLYKRASGSPNVRYMDYLLDFIEERYDLLPRESPSQQICFRPHFTAFVGVNKTRGGLQISLFGEEFPHGSSPACEISELAQVYHHAFGLSFTAQSLIQRHTSTASMPTLPASGLLRRSCSDWRSLRWSSVYESGTCPFGLAAERAGQVHCDHSPIR